VTMTTSSAAAILGRAGGLKGGPARAKALTYEERAAVSRSGGLAAQKLLRKKARANSRRRAARARRKEGATGK
jgi:hypothetical protein